MSLAPFRAVIFDCDGVLVDSEALGLRSLQQALSEIGIRTSSLDALSRFSGCSHRETLDELEREFGAPLPKSQIERRMDKCYATLVEIEGLQPCPGVPRLLLQLAACQIPFTLASSGPRTKVQFSLQRTGLAAAFPRFVCGDDVARAKPAPDLYIAAAALLNIPPEHCVAIEDAPKGVQAARSAKMQVVAVTTNFKSSELTNADLILDSLLDFPFDVGGRQPSWLDQLSVLCGTASRRIH